MKIISGVFVCERDTKEPRDCSRCWISVQIQNTAFFPPPSCTHSTSSAPKCGREKPALARRNTVDDKKQLISAMETEAKANASIGECHSVIEYSVLQNVYAIIVRCIGLIIHCPKSMQI